MRKTKKGSIYGIVGIALMILFCIIPAVKCEAAEPVIGTEERVSYGDFNYGIQDAYIRIKNLEPDAKITNLKTDRTSIARPKVEGTGKNRKIVLHFLKPGTVELSFQIEQEGKVYYFTESYAMKKQTNPCASFKIGPKDYNKKIWRSNEIGYTILSPKKKLKVSITPKKGWKIEGINLYAYKHNSNSNYYVSKKIRNRSTVNLKGKSGGITATFKNKKTGDMIYMSLGFIYL